MASLLLSLASLPCSRSPPASSSSSSHGSPPHAFTACPFREKRLRGRAPTQRRVGARFALAESGSPKFLDQEEPLLPLLRELADSLDLPPDYLAKLPRDLRLDVGVNFSYALVFDKFILFLCLHFLCHPLPSMGLLALMRVTEEFVFSSWWKLNDAAFDLSNGPVLDECGPELGDILLNLARSWEQADTSTSCSIASQFPLLQNSLEDNVKAAFGRRLVSAGRRFQSMGQYGQGELQRIAKAMAKTGKVLSASPVTKTDKKPKKETRVLKFGELQVALTPEKANIGAVIGFVFGILAWELSQGIQSIPESSLQYANDNKLLLAKSLRGALLALFYSSAVLSAFASVGLVLLGRQLGVESESKSEDK